MTIRSREMVFAGGMAVFPGGRVDPADFDLGARIGGPLDPDEAAHQIAVVRETLEETGLAIGLSGDIDAAKARAARDYLQQTGELAPVLDIPAAVTALLGQLQALTARLDEERAFILTRAHMLDLLKSDDEVTAALSETELEEKFDLAYHFKHVDTVFDRVFG